jgi:hypothetical protein
MGAGFAVLGAPLMGGGDVNFNPAFYGTVGLYLTASGGLYQDDAGTTPAVTDTDPVRLWVDPINAARYALSGSDGVRPLLKKSIIAGRDVLRFDGSDDQLVSTPFLSASYNKALAWLTVHIGVPTDGNIDVILSHNNQTWYVGRDRYEDVARLSALSASAVKAGHNNRVKIDDVWVTGGTYDGINYTVMSNGNVKSIASTANLGLNGALTIGSLSTNSLYYLGDLAEIVIWNTAISAATLRAASASLLAKYGSYLITHRLVCEGDSMTIGTVVAAGYDYPSQLMVLLGGKRAGYALWNVGQNGQTLAQMITSAATELDTVPCTDSVDILVLWAGTNDLKNALKSGADLAADYLSCCSARSVAGFKVVAMTIMPRSDGGTPVGFEAERLAFNAAVRLGGANYDALADIGSDSRVGDTGDELDTTYFIAGDRCHLNATGMGVAASLVWDAIQTL